MLALEEKSIITGAVVAKNSADETGFDSLSGNRSADACGEDQNNHDKFEDVFSENDNNCKDGSEWRDFDAFLVTEREGEAIHVLFAEKFDKGLLYAN